MKNLRRLLSFMAPYKKAIILAPLLIMFEVIMDLLQPTIMANIVDIGIARGNLNYVINNSLLMLGLTVLGIIGGVGSTYYAAYASQSGGADIRNALYKKVQSLSFSNIDKLKTGHLITCLTNDVTQVTNVLMMTLKVLIRVPVMGIGSIILAIIISPRLSIILLICIPVLLIIMSYIIKKAFPLYSKLQKKLDGINTVVQENLTGIRVVKAFVRENYEIDKFSNSNKNLMNVTLNANRLMAIVMPLMMLSINIVIVIALWLGSIEVSIGNMQIGQIIAFIQYTQRLLISLMMAAMVVTNISRSEASAERINEVLNEETTIIENKLVNNNIKFKGKVVFDNVTFSYKGKKDAVLKNLNFTINAGETVAIIGATGSGKSTLINLIPRLYDVTEGKVLIDGIDVRDIKKKDLRKNISIALQKTILFSGTIADNIRYGKKNATKDEIIQMAKIAQAHDFITQSINGYDTEVEQRGVNFSGGQKQRIAIARAIIKNPTILILDDTTSAVDVKTEGEIRKELKEIMKDRTTFIVAQRISSAKGADKIIVLEDGEICGLGTHTELIETNSIYQDIYESQIREEIQKYGE